ncbi:MAG: S-layer homology domain-containing protein [Oscillospiraceae bacterium]
MPPPSATHTSDATRKDFTAIVLYYDTVNKAWPAPIVNFALFVKCDTPTVTVTYTWDGLDSNDFDETHLAPTGPNDATPDKGSDYEVNDTFYSGYTVEDKNGVRYKFSGWSTDDATIENGQIKNIQTNVTLTGTWTKLGSGTFDLNDKIFKVFDKADGSRDIPSGNYTFKATVTRLDKETNELTDEKYTGTVTLNGATAAATPSFVFSSQITFHTGGEYRFLVEETPNTVKTLSSDEQIDYDNAVYYLYVTVSDDLKTINYRFEHVLVITSAEEEPAATENQPITFHNYYYAAKDPGTYDINFSDLVFKVLTKTGDRSFNGAEFTANVDGWRVHEIEIAMVRASAGFGFEPLNSVSLKAAFPADITFEVDGKAYRGFTGDTLTVTAGRYLFLIDEINDGQTNITYDESKYWLNLGFVENAEGEVSLVGQRVRKFVDGDTYETVLALEDSEWMIVDTSISPVYFENTIDTGKDDYYPIIIPTIINKDTGMLNKTDHFAYVIGYPDGTVHPNGQITRAEVATIFFRLLRDEVRDGAFTTSNTYSDVAYGKWYNNPISTMSALGIITGYPDGTFKPNKPITRAEFAAIAARFDETQSGKSATFSDVIGHWAAKEIGIAYYNDWIKGYPDGTFKPDQNITRAEAMTLINRVLERKPESPADLLTNMNKWTDNLDTSKWYYLDVQEATNSHGYTRKTFNYELWRQMLPDPDWSRYER